MTKSEALKLEYRIKQLPANKKISGFFKEGGRNDNCKGYESNNKRHGCWGSVRYASALGDDKECISEAIQVFRPCKTEVCLKQANEALASMEKM